MRGLTVPLLLEHRARMEPAHLAIRQGSAELSMAQWHERALRVSAGLLEAGVAPQDRVGLVFGGRDWIGYAVAYAAVTGIGGVAVPISAQAAPAEIAYMLEHCGAKAMLHGSGEVAVPETIAWHASVASLDGASFSGELPIPRPGDLAQILYTSGTTGRPKGVAASHANVTYGCALKPLQRRLAHSSLFVHCFPIGTNAGQTMLVNALDAAPGMLATARFTPGNFARLIAEHRVGTVFVVPAMAIELLRSGALAEHDMSSVVLFGSTAAALPPSVASGLSEALPDATIVNYYTSTEAAPAQTTMLFNPSRPGALGRPAVPGTLRVTGPDGRPVPVGEPGEVWLRSPVAPRSYYGDAEANARVFDGEWIRMGDVGFLDDEGHLYLVDRDSDVIKSGAYKVSTLQVESALYQHPDILDAAVVGVAHEVLGMVPAAALVATRPVRIPELRSFLAAHLAPHELPVRWQQVEFLPRNRAGKVLKTQVRQMFSKTTMDGGQP